MFVSFGGPVMERQTTTTQTRLTNHNLYMQNSMMASSAGINPYFFPTEDTSIIPIDSTIDHTATEYHHGYANYHVPSIATAASTADDDIVDKRFNLDDLFSDSITDTVASPQLDRTNTNQNLYNTNSSVIRGTLESINKYSGHMCCNHSIVQNNDSMISMPYSGFVRRERPTIPTLGTSSIMLSTPITTSIDDDDDIVDDESIANRINSHRHHHHRHHGRHYTNLVPDPLRTTFTLITPTPTTAPVATTVVDETAPYSFSGGNSAGWSVSTGPVVLPRTAGGKRRMVDIAPRELPPNVSLSTSSTDTTTGERINIQQMDAVDGSGNRKCCNTRRTAAGTKRTREPSSSSHGSYTSINLRKKSRGIPATGLPLSSHHPSQNHQVDSSLTVTNSTSSSSSISFSSRSSASMSTIPGGSSNTHRTECNKDSSSSCCCYTKKERNRVHAQKSRERRKCLTTDTEEKIHQLKQENSKLKEHIRKYCYSVDPTTIKTQQQEEWILDTQQEKKSTQRFIEMLKVPTNRVVVDDKTLQYLFELRRNVPVVVMDGVVKSNPKNTNTTNKNMSYGTTTTPRATRIATGPVNVEVSNITASSSSFSDDDDHSLFRNNSDVVPSKSDEYYNIGGDYTNHSHNHSNNNNNNNTVATAPESAAVGALQVVG
jgi:hypothetical protein